MSDQNQDTILRAARLLDDAAREARAVPQFSNEHAFDLPTAYVIQRAVVGQRIARGASRIGMKMGFTSRAKMAQMGVSDMIWGRLTSDMLLEEGGEVDLSRFIHPRVEPEICFLLKRPLAGIVTPMQALAAVEALAPALEIIDSRYQDFKFSVPDVVADNASSAALVVGRWHAPDTDVGNLGLILGFDGRPAELGSTAAILGHPIRALVAAARLAAEHGETLEAGHLIMAGGATAAAALPVGAGVRCEMQSLGSVAFRTSAKES